MVRLESDSPRAVDESGLDSYNTLDDYLNSFERYVLELGSHHHDPELESRINDGYLALFGDIFYYLGTPIFSDNISEVKAVLSDIFLRCTKIKPSRFGKKDVTNTSWGWAALSPTDVQTVVLRYGLADGVQRNLKQVSEEFGVTPQRVSQRLLRAQHFLRHPAHSRRFRDLS